MPRFVPPQRPRARNDAEHAQGSTRRPKSHQPRPARASSIGARLCWLVTTPPDGRSERHTHDRAQIRTKHAPTTPYATRKPRIDTRTPPNSPWGPGRRGSTGHRILQEEIRSRGLQNAEIAFLGGWYKFEAP